MITRAEDCIDEAIQELNDNESIPVEKLNKLREQLEDIKATMDEYLEEYGERNNGEYDSGDGDNY